MSVLAAVSPERRPGPGGRRLATRTLPPAGPAHLKKLRPSAVAVVAGRVVLLRPSAVAVVAGRVVLLRPSAVAVVGLAVVLVRSRCVPVRHGPHATGRHATVRTMSDGTVRHGQHGAGRPARHGPYRTSRHSAQPGRPHPATPTARDAPTRPVPSPTTTRVPLHATPGQQLRRSQTAHGRRREGARAGREGVFSWDQPVFSGGRRGWGMRVCGVGCDSGPVPQAGGPVVPVRWD